MNMKEALSRNRMVFEKLTGNYVNTVQTQNKRISHMIQTEHYEKGKQQEPLKHPVYEEYKDEWRPTFSLKDASDNTTYSFDAPENVVYPQITEITHITEEDSLETLYYRLAVDARRGSQLLNEEE